MPASGRSPFSVSKVSAPKSYDLLASQLREAILTGDIPEGSRLPTERELVIQTGLSRGSVREALRMLATEGLVNPRRGRLGGNMVSLPGSENLAHLIGQFVRGRKISVHALHETRELIEPLLARIAAQRRTPQDLDRLWALQNELVAAAGNFQRFSIVNVQWHLAVAEASGNELLATFLKSLSFGVAAATTTEVYNTTETRNAVIKIHDMINQAIEQQDGDKAERYMRRHLTATTARSTAQDVEA
ncbi:FadR/GntR family transcriptional regulator [Humitalea sp. 24SJ18S-53]|uniref:FadR/GntR family transcriptional regulator n=1 Tax=Humitalea sp. 24SJ18S-53 TaxID=3422307 RepID=UPI003D67364C